MTFIFHIYDKTKLNHYSKPAIRYGERIQGKDFCIYTHDIDGTGWYYYGNIRKDRI